MRDEQVRRYARHILLPDVGGLGQSALLGGRALIDGCGDAETGAAAALAARYLAAGGLGELVLDRVPPLDALPLDGPDTRIVEVPRGDAPLGMRRIPLPAVPAWWPGRDPDRAGDARPPVDPTTAGAAGHDDRGADLVARAFWRGALAATLHMAQIAARR